MALYEYAPVVIAYVQRWQLPKPVNSMITTEWVQLGCHRLLLKYNPLAPELLIYDVDSPGICVETGVMSSELKDHLTQLCHGVLNAVPELQRVRLVGYTPLVEATMAANDLQRRLNLCVSVPPSVHLSPAAFAQHQQLCEQEAQQRAQMVSQLHRLQAKAQETLESLHGWSRQSVSEFSLVRAV